MDCDAAGRKLLAQRVEGAKEIGALAVEHVHDHDAREVALLGPLPGAGRLHLDAHDGADHNERSLDDPQRGDHVALEAWVAGRVDQVDLAALPLEMAERRGQRHLPLVVVVVPVAGRIAGLDRAEPVDRAGLEEHRLDERGLTRRAVADDGDVADLSGLDGHLAGLLLGWLARSILSLRFPRDLVRGHGWGPGPRTWLGTRSPVISSSAMPWWEQAVVYQIYPRSCQDSDGDGVGDLRGVTERLDHLAWLGVDALWLSPIYPSPLADFGYDVSDYTAVDPVFGTLGDFDALVAAAHARGLRVLLDLVPSHTSIEHPWFREHPDRYIWSPVDGPPNNWRAVFGGSAWSRDPRGRGWYLHTFYAEQPDLDWRNPEVVAAMQDVVRFWLDRGADGFRVDAVNGLVKDAELRDDPPASGSFPLLLPPEAAELDHVYSAGRPEVIEALAALREAAGDALLVGEVYLGTADYPRYLESLDLVFAFELLFSPW